MNRREFFSTLVLGGIIIPRVPKLILTGGWFSVSPRTFDPIMTPELFHLTLERIFAQYYSAATEVDFIGSIDQVKKFEGVLQLWGNRSGKSAFL